MDTAAAARELGVSQRRIRAMAAARAIPAKRVGGRWQITLPAQRPPKTGGRPLSQACAVDLANSLHERTLQGLTGRARTRTAARIRALRESANPAALLRRWFPHGAPELGKHGRYLGSLIAMSFAGADDEVAERIAWRAPEYLRSRELLAEVVATERLIHGFSIKELATRAGVTEEEVQTLERGGWFPSPGAARKTLRALNVEPTALPTWEDGA